MMQLTDEEKRKLQEKINQEPDARKERNEKTIGISTGVVGGLLFPIGVILGVYWLLRGRKMRGIYTLVTTVIFLAIGRGIGLFPMAFIRMLVG